MFERMQCNDMNLILPSHLDPFIRAGPLSPLPYYIQTSFKNIHTGGTNHNAPPSFSFSLHFLVTIIIIPCLQCSPLSPTNNHIPQQELDSTMDPVELETLFNIMEALSSDQDWRASYPNPCQPGSSWPGLQCRHTTDLIHDPHYHVNRLDFGSPPNPSCKNSATFPPEIFQLPYLEAIFIFQCFTHSPTTISLPISLNDPFSFTSLQQFSLRANSALIGTIPPQISSLKSLQIVTLSQNSLTGHIPAGAFNLSSIVHLDLSYNHLTGPIPVQLGSLENLVGLDLSYNNLIGPIPPSIGRLGTLQKLDLSSNSLTGTIPDTIQHLNSLIFLALSSNRFTGEFPGGLTGLMSLQYFLMDDNPMFVPLPLELAQLSKLQELRLSNSGYSGTIPPAYSQLKNLSTLSLQNNRLSGQIPSGFANLSHIFHLNLSRNFLDGVVPFSSSFLKRLGKNLDMSGNPGLCLNPSAGDAGDVGVGACGNGNSSSSIEPLEISEATLKKYSLKLLTITIVLILL